jgi:hypothetical protein
MRLLREQADTLCSKYSHVKNSYDENRKMLKVEFWSIYHEGEMQYIEVGITAAPSVEVALVTSGKLAPKETNRVPLKVDTSAISLDDILSEVKENFFNRILAVVIIDPRTCHEYFS